MATLKSLLLFLSLSTPILCVPMMPDPFAASRHGVKRMEYHPRVRSSYAQSRPRLRESSAPHSSSLSFSGEQGGYPSTNRPKTNGTESSSNPNFNKPPKSTYTQSWSYGCYTEPGGHTSRSHSRRALTGPSYIAQENMTLDTCEHFCIQESGFNLWGVEYGGECYCGNSLSHGSFPTFPDDCDLPCPGDTNEYCGGQNRLSLYGSEPYPPKVFASSHPAVYEYKYLGCWSEAEGTRALTGASVYSARFMTVERCGNFCIDSGFTGFGVEYGSECFCGNELARSSQMVYGKDCDMECSGKGGEVCGGRERLSLYLWI